MTFRSKCRYLPQSAWSYSPAVCIGDSPLARDGEGGTQGVRVDQRQARSLRSQVKTATNIWALLGQLV